MQPQVSWHIANLGFVGYGIASAFFLLFSLLLLTSWRGRLQGGLLLLVSLVSMVWAAASALLAGSGAVAVHLIWSLESLRHLTLLLFLLRLLGQQAEGHPQRKQLLRLATRGILVFCLILLLPLELVLPEFLFSSQGGIPHLRLLSHIILAVAGLALVEQFYRNTPWEQRWGIKYLALGFGTVLVFDFYLFADALLFNRLDFNIWQARGAINALAVPLLGISAARNPQWSLDLFVSRKVVFHTTAIAAAGTYLLFMALAGYYIRIYGGEWSNVLEIVFFAGAGLVLLVLLFSGQLRARLKIFISKHFFSYKYDYREEWLRLIGILSNRKAMQSPLNERVIFGLSEIVDSPEGALWLGSEQDGFVHSARWNLSKDCIDENWEASAMRAYLEDTQWVINIEEYALDAESYEGLDLPEWLVQGGHFWLLVPMFHEETLIGFVLLAKPRAPQKLDWETLDMLKTAGRQAASYLALERAANALAEARQFEGFNRLSAFVMHDLKNLIAQLSLVAKNAERHKNNPEFIDDAILTIKNSVDKMNRLMAQLRSAIPGKHHDKIPLRRLLRQLAAERGAQMPVPLFSATNGDEVQVYANRDRLGAVVGHVVQNAQEATGAGGRVEIQLKTLDDYAVIEVEDDGIGMDESFIKTRLFKPFDSTKGLTGMGIGAYECREFVVSLGGRVSVVSRPGEGTRFSIFLPLPPEATAGENAH